MANLIKLRRDIAANWADPGTNPVLDQGEPGFEIDSNKLKIGNGTSRWTDLPYISTNDLPPNANGYLRNDGAGNLTWVAIQQVNSDWNLATGPGAILNKPDIPKDVNELSDVDELLTPVFVRTLEETIGDLLPFDFGTIVARDVRNRLEWLLYTADVDNGTITDPANVNHDAGTLI